MDYLLTFMLGVWFSPYFIAVTFLWIILLDHWESNGWALIWTGLLLTAVYMVFKPELEIVGYACALYFPTGLTWSIYRWKRYCENEYKKTQKRLDSLSIPETDDDLKYFTRRQKNIVDEFKISTKPYKHTSRIVNWIILFPFSVINTLFADIFDLITKVVKDYLIGLYENIANGYTNKLPKGDSKNED